MQQETLKQGLGLVDEHDSAMPQKQIFIYDYSKFLNQGFDFDEQLAKKFQPIAQKLNLSQESVDLLLEIALEMSKKQKAFYDSAAKKDKKTRLDEDIVKYDDMFKADPELPKVNSGKIQQYMKLANEAYMNFATDKLKELLESTGLNFHPEVIKLFHKIGELSQEDDFNFSGKPAFDELSPAEILYGSTSK